MKGGALDAIEAKVLGGEAGMTGWTDALRRLAGQAAVCAGCCALLGTALPAAAQDREVRAVILEQNRVIEQYRPPLELQRRVDLAVPLERRALVDLPEQPYRLERVVLTGGESVDPHGRAALWRPLLGTAVGRAEIEGVVLALERFYRESDYFARALVTGWNTATGVLSIEIFEGYLEEIVVESSVPEMAARLRPHLDRIASIVPLRVSRLERELLLIADYDGFEVLATVSQIPERVGAGRLLLEIEPVAPGAMVSLNNWSSPDIGPLQVSAVAFGGDIFGLFEQTTLVAAANPADPRAFWLGQWSQDLPVGRQGLRFGYSVGYIGSVPGGEAARQAIEVDSIIGSAWLQYPFLRRIERNLIGRLELEAQDDRVWAGRRQVVGDRQRWLTASASYDQTFEAGAVLARVAYSQGLRGLGASDADNRLAGRAQRAPDFRMVSGEAEWTQGLGAGWSLQAAATGQIAFDRLPAAVRLPVGDDRFARAFANTTVSADTALLGGLTVRYAMGAAMPGLDGLSVFAFADYGGLRNDPVGADFRHAHVGSVGAGLAYRGLGEIVVTTPSVSSQGLDHRGTQIFFQLAHRF